MKKLNREELAELIKMNKRDQILYLLEKYDNYVPLVLNGRQFYFTVHQVKDICDMTEKFREQLESEGKMHYYCEGLVSSVGETLAMESLPIYGHYDRYETKWFKETRSEVIRSVIRDKYRITYDEMIAFQMNEEEEN